MAIGAGPQNHSVPNISASRSRLNRADPPACIVRLAAPVDGVTDGVGDGYITFVPFADELLPTIGTVMLYGAQTSPKRVVKADGV